MAWGVARTTWKINAGSVKNKRSNEEMYNILRRHNIRPVYRSYGPQSTPSSSPVMVGAGSKAIRGDENAPDVRPRNKSGLQNHDGPF